MDNLAELFKMEKAHIKQLTRLGILPALDKTPLRYDKEKIDEWVAAGNLKKHRAAPYHHPRGVWA